MKFLHIIMVAIFVQIVFIILHIAMQIGILLKMYKISDFIFDSARVFIAVDVMQWQDDEECRNSLSDWGHSSIKNESKISLTLSKLSLSIWSFLHFNEWEKIFADQKYKQKPYSNNNEFGGPYHITDISWT